MMAARAYAAKGVLGLAVHHRVDRAQTRPDGAQTRFERAGRHDRVTVEINLAPIRRSGADRLHIVFWMDEQQSLVIGLRRFLALQSGKGFVLQNLLHSADAVRAFGMTRAGVVIFERLMREIQRGHTAR